jgi:hypothetical protein
VAQPQGQQGPQAVALVSRGWGLGALLWDPRRARSDAAPSAGGAALADDGQQVPTKALRKFLASLRSREAPVLLDLGPVVGSNVAFFGERLGCKILIEDRVR